MLAVVTLCRGPVWRPPIGAAPGEEEEEAEETGQLYVCTITPAKFCITCTQLKVGKLKAVFEDLQMDNKMHK